MNDRNWFKATFGLSAPSDMPDAQIDRFADELLSFGNELKAALLEAAQEAKSEPGWLWDRVLSEKSLPSKIDDRPQFDAPGEEPTRADDKHNACAPDHDIER